MGLFDSLLGGLFGGNPKDNLLNTDDILDMFRKQQVMNSLNVENPYGDSSITFDSNGQPTMTQSFSPEMQNLFNMQNAFAGNGPQQYKQEDLGHLENMYNNFASRTGAGQGFDLNRQLGAHLQQKPLNMPDQPQPQPQPTSRQPYSPRFSPRQNYNERFVNDMPPYRRR